MIPLRASFDCALDIVLAFSMVVPYLCYSVAYFKPFFFQRHATQDGLVMFSSVLKAICMTCYGFLALRGGINTKGLIIGIPFIIIGQYLNMVVYKKLGKVRAYYGWELRLFTGPMLCGFPWDIGHAQYKGLMLSVIGTWFCFNPTVKFTAFTMLWVFMYFYIIVVETLPSGR